jgi:hypothetical protein
MERRACSDVVVDPNIIVRAVFVLSINDLHIQPLGRCRRRTYQKHAINVFRKLHLNLRLVGCLILPQYHPIPFLRKWAGGRVAPHRLGCPIHTPHLADGWGARVPTHPQSQASGPSMAERQNHHHPNGGWPTHRTHPGCPIHDGFLVMGGVHLRCAPVTRDCIVGAMGGANPPPRKSCQAPKTTTNPPTHSLQSR